MSVIIPVFNCEAYLNKCIDSVANQTYINLEIILVDDGSTDACGQICDAYAKRDNRITVIHKQNAGAGAARNAALEICRGEYVVFIDSDDFLALDAIQVLYERSSKDKSDLVIGKHKLVDGNGFYTDAQLIWDSDEIYTANDVFAQMKSYAQFPVALWGKLFKRHILEGISIPQISIGEDLWVFPQIVENCKKISIDNTVVYYYQQRNGSLMHRKSEKFQKDNLNATLHTAYYLYRRGFRDSALVWYNVAINLAFTIKAKKDRLQFFNQYFAKNENQELLRALGIKSRFLWGCLHIPYISQLRQIMKSAMRRIIKAGR